MKLDSENVLYELLENKKKLLDRLETKLFDYNFNASNKLELVFFDDAVNHIIAILRILMQPRGNAMLIGVSGSGKQTLTKLAAFILEHQILQVKLSRSFTPADFRSTIKDSMLNSGCNS
jgi:dynein heavy chain, axonemal